MGNIHLYTTTFRREKTRARLMRLMVHTASCVTFCLQLN